MKFVNFLLEEVTKDDYLNAYYNRINKERDNLLDKGSRNDNFVFVLGVDVKNNPCGDPNRCETNTYEFIKEKLSKGKTNYYPVGGFFFSPKSLWPVEHWWVYDSTTNEHIEITPFGGSERPWAYGGIINYEINDDILNSRNVYDVDFFRGGNVYSWYFK